MKGWGNHVGKPQVINAQLRGVGVGKGKYYKMATLKRLFPCREDQLCPFLLEALQMY